MSKTVTSVLQPHVGTIWPTMEDAQRDAFSHLSEPPYSWTESALVTAALMDNTATIASLEHIEDAIVELERWIPKITKRIH
jgi:hypothetical protein